MVAASVFNDNEYGIFGHESTIHLHGEATAIHSNGTDGIYAFDGSKVFIHLPSHHNTFRTSTCFKRKFVGCFVYL